MRHTWAPALSHAAVAAAKPSALPAAAATTSPPAAAGPASPPISAAVAKPARAEPLELAPSPLATLVAAKPAAAPAAADAIAPRAAAAAARPAVPPAAAAAAAPAPAASSARPAAAPGPLQLAPAPSQQQLAVHGVPLRPAPSAGALPPPGAGLASRPGSAVGAPQRRREGVQRRVVRVFVSSTFQDMQAERDLIRSHCNPTLKTLCAARGLFFQPVDLRWGIRDEAVQAGLVIRLCLREVHRSTYFVGLVKDRYGWHVRGEAGVSEESDASFRLNLERAAEEFPEVAAMADRSVTEIEIRSGVMQSLDEMRGRSLFYFAGARQAEEARRGPAAGREGPEAERRLEALKAAIRGAGLPVAPYDDPEQLALAMRAALAALLERDYPQAGERPWLEAERAQHEGFAASRRRVFVRSERDLAALSEYAAGAGPELFVLHGDGGCGKSALLANWAEEWGERHRGALLVQHYIGGSQSSSLLSSIARRVVEEVRAQWPEEEGLDLRGTDAELAARLAAFLAAGAARWPAPVLLVLDGLDQLRGDPAARLLHWLPRAAGPRLRILASSLPGPALEAARGAGRPHVAYELAPLGEGRRRRVVERLLAEQGRALSEERLARIVTAPACSNALFLTILLEQLSASAVHERLDAEIAALLSCGGIAGAGPERGPGGAAAGPRELFRFVLRRLGEQHGAALVRGAASAVACARHGMAEGELKELAGVDAPGGPPGLAWSLFWQAFLDLSVCRDGLYGFFHRCTAEAAELEFGLEAGGERRAAEHARLGAFFAAQPPSERRAAEGPWGLARGGAGCGERLAGMLCEADVMRRLDEYEQVELWLASGRAAEAAARLAAALRLPFDDAEAAGLERAGSLLLRMGKYEDGIRFGQKALQLKQKALGPEHPDVAMSMQNLAVLLQAQGDFKAARPLYERALKIKQQALGPEHPDVTMTMDNLAGLLQAQGDFKAARPMYEGALRVKRKLLGSEHPDVAGTVQNLAVLLEAQGDHAAARPLYEEALRIQQKALGTEHPSVATTMQNLGGLMKAQGDFAAAKELYEGALRINTKALGPEHPDVAGTMQNLANLSQAQGDIAAARPLYEEALRIKQKALGPEHPSVAMTMQNLAILLKAQGDLKAARPVYEEALRIEQKALGAEHPRVAMTMQNLATLLKAKGELKAARPLYEKALRIEQKALGPEHPDVAMTMQNLALLLKTQGDYAAARPLYEARLRAALACAPPAADACGRRRCG
eukprot:tig00000857_g4933.t1